MTDSINSRLRKLNELWTDASEDSLRGIPVLSREIAMLAQDSTVKDHIDMVLVHRAEILATMAERRLSACLAIEIRTGSYLRSGSHELVRGIATAGWEG